MINLTIDGRHVSVPPGTSVLDARHVAHRGDAYAEPPGGVEHRGLRWDRDPPAVDRQGDHGRGTCGCCRGARTPACRVETRLDTGCGCDPVSNQERPHEWGRGRHECLRHMWIWALMGSPPRWHRPGTPGGTCRSVCRGARPPRAFHTDDTQWRPPGRPARTACTRCSCRSPGNGSGQGSGPRGSALRGGPRTPRGSILVWSIPGWAPFARARTCLLYTSDAADE